MATLLSTTGHSSEAEALYREALEGCRKTLGEDDLDTLFSADNLGALLFRQGRASEAETFFRSAQRGLASKLGRSDPEALRSADNLAVTLMVPEISAPEGCLHGFSIRESFRKGKSCFGAQMLMKLDEILVILDES